MRGDCGVWWNRGGLGVAFMGEDKRTLKNIIVPENPVFMRITNKSYIGEVMIFDVQVSKPRGQKDIEK